MAALILDEKCGLCLDKNNFCVMTNGAGYYPGPVAPATADVSPIWATLSSQFELVPRGQLRLAVKRND